MKGNETPEQANEIMRLFFDDLRTIYKGDTALATLWDSTAEFHERFETIEDKEHPFIPAQYRAFMEEVAEFSIEVLRDNADDPANLERELADVIVVGMGLLMAHGRTLEHLETALAAVAAKNDAKTLDSHAKNAKGKVARKEVKP